jgi:Uma2 family endonuclease
MGKTQKREATYDDLLKLPENLVGELIDGELFASPRPASPHAHAAQTLTVDLGGPFSRSPGGPGGWWFLSEPELHFGKNVVVPDIAAWRRERMPTVPNVAAFELAPDWVCEVISPSTGRIDRGKKTRVYARAKVAHMWIIDPLQRTFENYRLENGRWSLLDTYEGEGRVRAEPFDAIELDMAGWWIPATDPSLKK